MTFDQLLKECQSINYNCEHWEDQISDEAYELITKHPSVKENLDLDRRRWYEITTTVYRIGTRYLGIRYITNMFSESQEYCDCNVEPKFFEMSPIKEVSFVKMNS